MKSKVCFIDDDNKFEIPLFEKMFSEEFDLVTATSFPDCCDKIRRLRDWVPDIFVLDLYFPKPSETPDRGLIRTLEKSPLQLPPDGAEVRQCYLNYLDAKNRLSAVLNAWKQSADGGIELAKLVRAEFPNIPIVFYSRKALSEDVLRCMKEEGVCDVIAKPSGRNDEETEAISMDSRDTIATQIKKDVHNSKPGQRRKMKRLKDAARVVLETVQFFADALPTGK
jgi:CheY-like chemotaxis protein